jgi:hypothetical protein
MNNVELNDSWTLYLHYKDLGTCYNDNVEKLIEIKDIITFWGTINNIPKTYNLFSDGSSNIKKIKRTNCTPCAYSFFKTGISPYWEDDQNKHGCEYSIRTNYSFEYFHRIWIHSLVTLISCDNVLCDVINGIRVVDCTKQSSVLYRIEYWFKNDVSKTSQVTKINEIFKLNGYKIIYKSHKNMKEST